MYKFEMSAKLPQRFCSCNNKNTKIKCNYNALDIIIYATEPTNILVQTDNKH